MSNQDTEPPPSIEELNMAEAIEHIADELDHTRDIARNGNLEVIKQVGLLKQSLETRFDNIDKALREMALHNESEREKNEKRHRQNELTIQRIKRGLSNGNSPAE